MDQRDKLGPFDYYVICWEAPTRYATKEEAEKTMARGRHPEMGLPQDVFVMRKTGTLEVVG